MKNGISNTNNNCNKKRGFSNADHYKISLHLKLLVCLYNKIKKQRLKAPGNRTPMDVTDILTVRIKNTAFNHQTWYELFSTWVK